jgi:hypothetical protein
MGRNFTAEERRRGGINVHKKHPDMASRLMKKNHDVTGKGSIIRGQEERKVVNRIKEEYDDIFAPNAVCDKIAFKDNKIIFIEIKRKGQKLRPRQAKFKKLVQEKYIIEYV